jgi:3-carboxy-cis,cis-muconate cycloisomerase
MNDLLWPGDHRAGDLLTDAAVLDAMLAVEAAWSESLAAAGIFPSEAAVGRDALRVLVGDDDLAAITADAEAGGNPVIPLVRLLRDRLRPDRPEGRWLHRGLTSQDVVDSALMMGARDAVRTIRGQLLDQVALLAALAERHRGTPTVARTLTQHAVPTTFGHKAARWLAGVLDGYDDLARLVFPAQLGGASGTMAAAVELAGHLPDPAAAVRTAVAEAAARVGLDPADPWHTVRTPVTRVGDAVTGCTDAWGRLAGDVLTLSRPEVGEVSEGNGGGSSTMPHKANPTLSVLVRRAALAGPPLAATLHASAAGAVDERPPGEWHVEWATLRTLLRRAVVAGSQTTDLLRDLQVRPDRMAATLAAAEGVDAEQAGMVELAGRAPSADYLGLTDEYVDAVLARAAGVSREAES